MSSRPPLFEGVRIDNPKLFPARWGGYCSVCGEWMEQGETIGYPPDRDKPAHEACLPSTPEPGKTAGGKPTYLTYDGEWFVWRATSDENHLVNSRGAGFMYRGYPKDGDRWPYKGERLWITNKTERAHVLREYADAKALKALDKFGEAVAESWAEDAELDCPAPQGLEYRPYQRAGIKTMLKRGMVLLADEMGTGKCHPVDTKILTPAGWVKIGTLAPEDYVIGSDGTPVEVTGVFPQGVKPSYRVQFSDGSNVESGGEHLWTVRYRRGGKVWQDLVLTTDQLRGNSLLSPKKHANGVTTQLDLSKTALYLPMLLGPVLFDSGPLPLPAYLLGQLIANGYLKGTTPVLSTNAKDWPEVERNLLASGAKLGAVTQYDNVIRAHFPGTIRIVKALELNELSRNKRIPYVYRFASVEDRIALFHGLMDGDGSISKTQSRITYSTLSPQLAEDVRELVEGLGGIASVRKYDRSHYDKPVEYAVRIRVPTWVAPFSVSRKLSRYNPGSHAHPTRVVKSVEYVRDVESVCISVEADDQLYVTEHCILTHNTIQFLGLANCLPKTKRILVIAPRVAVINWREEVEKWLVTKNWTVWSPKTKKDLPPKADKLFVVVNYQKLTGKSPFYDALMKIKWGILGVDEAQNVKNKKTQQGKRILGENLPPKWDEGEWTNIPGLADKAERVIFITGTPIPNKVMDIHPVLAKLDKQFRSFKFFATRYAGGSLETVYGKKRWVWGEPTHLDELQAKLRAGPMIRRLKKDVLKELPPKTRQIITIGWDDLSGDTKRTLKAEKKIWDKLVAELGEAEAYKQLAEDMASPGRKPRFEEMARARAATGIEKAPYVAQHVADMLESGLTKILVFAHHHDVTDTIVIELTIGNDAPLTMDEIEVYDGRDPDDERRHAKIKRFQNDPTLKVMVLGIMAAGTAITLTASSNVVFAELPWRPMDVTQAEDRTHRIGQKNPVLIQHIALESSLDNRMVELLISKQAIADAVLDDDTGETVAQLKETVTEREKETARLRSKAADELEKWKAGRESRIASGKVSRAMSTRDVEEMAERAKLTDEQIETVGQAIGLLCDMDSDRATKKNDMGFNKADVALGHALAGLYRSGLMTSKEAFLGAYIGHKYHGQIGAEVGDTMREIVGLKAKYSEKAKPVTKPVEKEEITFALPKLSAKLLRKTMVHQDWPWLSSPGPREKYTSFYIDASQADSKGLRALVQELTPSYSLANDQAIAVISQVLEQLLGGKGKEPSGARTAKEARRAWRTMGENGVYGITATPSHYMTVRRADKLIQGEAPVPSAKAQLHDEEEPGRLWWFKTMRDAMLYGYARRNEVSFKAPEPVAETRLPTGEGYAHIEEDLPSTEPPVTKAIKGLPEPDLKALAEEPADAVVRHLTACLDDGDKDKAKAIWAIVWDKQAVRDLLTKERLAELDDMSAQGRQGMGAKEGAKRIRAALKQISGKPWSVRLGKGTDYNWIQIDSPPKRYQKMEGEPYDRMTEADARELAEIVGDDVSHPTALLNFRVNSYSVSPGSMDPLVDRLEALVKFPAKAPAKSLPKPVKVAPEPPLVEPTKPSAEADIRKRMYDLAVAEVLDELMGADEEPKPKNDPPKTVGSGRCDECERWSRERTRCWDSSGLVGYCCYRCASMAPYERSFG